MSKIVLGSGKLYVTTFNGTVPESATIETASNLLGHIQGGASLTYKPTYYEAKDDLGLVSKKIITDEEAILKSGIMTFEAETLKKLVSTGRVTTTSGKKTIKIGGVANFDGAKYLIRFVHSDPVDGEIRLTVVGTNEAGLDLVFAKDKETVINAEFKAQALDSAGTLIIYEENAASGSSLATK